MNYYLGIDLGGTNIAVGIVNDEEKLIATNSTPTPQSTTTEGLCSTIENFCKEFLKENNIKTEELSGIGIGAPGQVDVTNSTISFICNLNLRNVNIGEYLTEKMGVPTYVCNDADAAAFGEAKAGSAKGYNKCVAVTLGTGVGTGIIIGSDIIPSEGGHMVIVYDGEPCNCGRKGCYESYASATALIRQTKKAMDENPTSKLWEVANENAGKVNGKTVFDAMDRDDEVAKKVFDTYINYVGCGLVDIGNTLRPDIICLGGGICAQGERLTKPLNEYMQREQYPLPTGEYTKVVTCSLGNDAGIIGAALYSKYKK